MVKSKVYSTVVLWRYTVLFVQTITIKVDRRIVKVVEEMIRLGIARSRNHAYNILIEAGLPKVLELIEHKKKVESLTDKFLHEGLPYENLPTVEDVEEGRER